MNRRKAIVNEKKEIRDNLKRVKAIVSIYEQMKPYMKRAFLYELEGTRAYQEDYLIYQALVKRLKDSYGKTVSEVAAFIQNQKDQLDYAKAVDKELSAQYKAIYRYVKSERFVNSNNYISFYQAVGHTEARKKAREQNLFLSEMKIVRTKKNPDVYARVMVSPDYAEGGVTITTRVIVYNSKDEVLEDVSSADMSSKDFNKTLNALASNYKLYQCEVSKDDSYKQSLRH